MSPVYEDDRLTAIQTPSSRYTFEYTEFGLRSQISLRDVVLARYTYTDDQNKYLQRLWYGNGSRVDYTYDGKGRLLTQTYEDGDTVSYTYDNNGALATMKDSATGRTTTYYYDLTDRMMKYTEKGTNYSHSVGYAYDTKNNLTQQVEEINGTKHTTSYTYDDDNRVTTLNADGTTVEYSYDTYGRVERKVTKNGTQTVLEEIYSYVTPNATTTSTQIATHSITAGGATTNYTYTYDDNGNITSVSDGTNTVTYEYDSANQLTKELNTATGLGATWFYDDAGNITSSDKLCYDESFDGFTAYYEVLYRYESEDWGDLLTSYDQGDVISDHIGNPTSYSGWNFTWEHGRQLASVSKGTTTWTYTYNADGLRTQKSNGTDTYNYVYNGSQLTRMTSSGRTLDFTYDANGTPLTVALNGYVYYYVTNLQGDVIGIANSNGTLVVSYRYNAWGECTITSNSTTFALLNPLRYRGYVYDQETGLYYLQSRYYNPEMARFLNADAFASTGQGLTGNNMFAYCGNNPINCADTAGTYFTYCNIMIGPALGCRMESGGNATGVSTTGFGGGGDVVSFPIPGLTGAEVEIIDTACDLIDVYGDLTEAEEYGIKAYNTLKQELAGTGLEAHHIVEQRFLNGQSIKTGTALSVAVTKTEHQKFTNKWRRYFPYGDTDYSDPKTINRVWEASQDIYKDYPKLLDAVWDTIGHLIK